MDIQTMWDDIREDNRFSSPLESSDWEILQAFYAELSSKLAGQDLENFTKLVKSHHSRFPSRSTWFLDLVTNSPEDPVGLLFDQYQSKCMELLSVRQKELKKLFAK